MEKVPNIILPNEFNENLEKQFFIKSAFNDEECKQIIQNSQYFHEYEAYLDEHGINKNVRNTKVRYLNINEGNSWISTKILNIVSEINKKYYKFNLTYLSPLNVLEYTTGCFYDWHVDMGGKTESSNRKLSVIVFLNSSEEYEGGNLKFFPPNTRKKINFEKGNIVIFPSYQAHKVEKVTKGKRFTLVTWVHGKPFS